MVACKLMKIAKEFSLLDQPFVKDDKQSIGDLIEEATVKLGENIVVRRFVIRSRHAWKGCRS